MSEFSEFVTAELKELESRDVDTLYECIRENLIDMGYSLSMRDDNNLYEEIETQLKG